MRLSIDKAKLDPRRKAWVKYVLQCAVVYESPAGHLFTDHLDDEGGLSSEVDEDALTEVLRRYIAEELSSDRARIARQVELVRMYCGTGPLRMLDVGCGGGLFLARMQQAGAEVEGSDWFHRAGELSYRLSRGRYPTLLNLMYSNHAYGHKQIFSGNELRELLEQAGLEIELLCTVHELSLPYGTYLRNLLRSARAASLLTPAAHAFFTWLPVRNKLLAVARKKASPIAGSRDHA